MGRRQKLKQNLWSWLDTLIIAAALQLWDVHVSCSIDLLSLSPNHFTSVSKGEVFYFNSCNFFLIEKWHGFGKLVFCQQEAG